MIGGTMSEELNQGVRMEVPHAAQQIIALVILGIIINDVLKEEDSLHIQLLNKIGGC